MTVTPARYALLSVSDKTHLIELARRLDALGFTLLSTGGSAATLREAGLPVVQVSDHTASPELLDGRVKTLHPRIHAGILAKRSLAQHQAQLEQHQIPAIELVVVNLYPFIQAVHAQPDLPMAQAMELVDIGGPTMVRAAAKNHQEGVVVVVDPADYEQVALALERQGRVEDQARQALALKAFRHTARYDAAIVEHLEARLREADAPLAQPDDASAQAQEASLPARVTLCLERVEALRYGENPHQRAALYTPQGQPPWGGVQVLGGKALSTNNLVDADAALALVAELSEAPAAAIIKHTNPAGCAWHEASLEQAYEDALACDPKSAFGGIVALNRRVEAPLAERLVEHFYEVIAAPDYSPEALEFLGHKKALRVLRTPAALSWPALTMRQTVFGALLQDQDSPMPHAALSWRVVTARAPDEQTQRALWFAWRVCKHVKSNAIVLAQQTRTIGVGAGQMSRVDAVELAVGKAGALSQGAVLASDAFFPFRDGVDAAAQAGVRAIIQPGGSKRDDEVIAACDEHGIAMILTGVRHFRH